MPTIDSIPQQTLNVGDGNASTLTLVASGISDPTTVSVQLSGDNASMLTVGATTATSTGTTGTYNVSTVVTGTLAQGMPVPMEPQLNATVLADGNISVPCPVPCTFTNPQTTG